MSCDQRDRYALALKLPPHPSPIAHCLCVSFKSMMHSCVLQARVPPASPPVIASALERSLTSATCVTPPQVPSICCDVLPRCLFVLCLIQPLPADVASQTICGSVLLFFGVCFICFFFPFCCIDYSLKFGNPLEFVCVWWNLIFLKELLAETVEIFALVVQHINNKTLAYSDPFLSVVPRNCPKAWEFKLSKD